VSVARKVMVWSGLENRSRRSQTFAFMYRQLRDFLAVMLANGLLEYKLHWLQ
jgi:hypothetical protein